MEPKWFDLKYKLDKIRLKNWQLGTSVRGIRGKSALNHNGFLNDREFVLFLFCSLFQGVDSRNPNRLIGADMDLPAATKWQSFCRYQTGQFHT
jgi:hypothetical protein